MKTINFSDKMETLQVSPEELQVIAELKFKKAFSLIGTSFDVTPVISFLKINNENYDWIEDPVVRYLNTFHCLDLSAFEESTSVKLKNIVKELFEQKGVKL